MGDAVNPIKVSIHQFCGFEINDFAVTVAKTALWIAESQMMRETEDIVHMQLDFLPLETNATIIECNALRIDWWRYVDRHSLSYIMGNPPFNGSSTRSSQQTEDMGVIAFSDQKKWGKIDYCGAWYYMATKFIAGNPNIRAAFVSTNSLCQGEQVEAMWKPLFDMGIHIDFAYRTFVWDSEATDKAHVHCVIIGFSMGSHDTIRKIYTNGNVLIAANINGYLIDAPNVFIPARSNPIDDKHLHIVQGCKPVDGGNFVIENYNEFVKNNPQIEKYIRPYIGSAEFIQNKKRWCLWLPQ